MKRVLLLLCCALCLSAALPIIAKASADIRPWRKHHKEAAKTEKAPKPKAKKTLLHRHAKPTREDAARSEVAYGMTGPKSVGTRHPQPGPAGVGAR